MNVLVLNGVNLDQLARRDPSLYGGLSLNELERRIYEWAQALGETALYTDFRYLEAAKAVEGVEVERASRTLFSDLAGALQGEIGFEADDLSYATWQVLTGGGATLVPRSGLVEAL